MNDTSNSTARHVIQEELASSLPKETNAFNVLFYKSKPLKSRPLIYRQPPRSKKDRDEKKDSAGKLKNPKTVKGSSVSKNTKGKTQKKKPKNTIDALKVIESLKDKDYVTSYFILLTHENLIVYAIELIVYDAPGGIQTLFVSKADTTGHYGLSPSSDTSGKPPTLSYAKVTEGILRAVIRCFIDPLRPLRINLFARAEKHYLFPFSSEHPNRKHLLTGAELVRWWIKVLDNVCETSSSAVDGEKRIPVIKTVERARLQIPGSEPPRIKSYFPARQRSNAPADSAPEKFQWQVGDIFWPDDDPKYPAVRCVPRFSDDPLTRYIDFLVGERRATTTTQKIFWMELQTRQEFRLSIVVGVVGIEGKVNLESSVYYSDKPSQDLRNEKVQETENTLESDRKRILNLSTATAVDKKISEKGGSEFATTSKWYIDRVHEYVTTLDYGELKMNETATTRLLSTCDPKVKFEIKGTLEQRATPVHTAVATGGVNILTGLVKKKKKPQQGLGVTAMADTTKESQEANSASTVISSTGDEVNTLSTSLIRKKPKKK